MHYLPLEKKANLEGCIEDNNTVDIDTLPNQQLQSSTSIYTISAS